MTLFDDRDVKNAYWSASIESRQQGRKSQLWRVPEDVGVDVVAMQVILGAVKEYGKIDHVLMKIDIEGSEYEAVSAAVLHRVFCAGVRSGINNIVIEEHGSRIPGSPPNGTAFLESMYWYARKHESCQVKTLGIDDETYKSDVSNKTQIDSKGHTCFVG